MRHRPVASLGERLEAAAISLKMIAARDADISPFVATMAERFSVDERALRGAFGSPATQRTYDRIHSNVDWETVL
jgi:hypothetical protein